MYNGTVPSVILDGGKEVLLANFYVQRSLKCALHHPGSCNCAIFCHVLVPHLNSTELHLQGVAPRSQYSDPAPEAVTLH